MTGIDVYLTNVTARRHMAERWAVSQLGQNQPFITHKAPESILRFAMSAPILYLVTTKSSAMVCSCWSSSPDMLVSGGIQEELVTFSLASRVGWWSTARFGSYSLRQQPPWKRARWPITAPHFKIKATELRTDWQRDLCGSSGKLYLVFSSYIFQFGIEMWFMDKQSI